MTIPSIIYGTAWKEDATQEFVLKAIQLGYRAIDTANQRRHYHEAAVGSAIIASGIAREHFFLQTKFTHLASQDHRLPYDPHAPIQTKVRQSFQSSLEHLHTTYLDSYLLHGPSTQRGLSTADIEVWQEMEALHFEKKVKYLGISNINIEQLKLLYQQATIKPTLVQNRCYAHRGWDKDVREFCIKKNIIYQGFSLLTANSFVLPHLQPIALRLHKTPAQVLFRFAQQISILPLTGTTSPKHMQEDLALDFDLNNEEIEYIKTINH